MIFVDSSYMIALVNERDPYHDEAVELLATQAEHEIWVTSHLVLGRLWDFLAARADLRSARWILSTISTARHGKTLPLTQAQQAEAFGLLRTGSDPLSYVDATSITIMRALGIHRAFTFLSGLERYGIEPIRD